MSGNFKIEIGWEIDQILVASLLKQVSVVFSRTWVNLTRIIMMLVSKDYRKDARQKF